MNDHVIEEHRGDLTLSTDRARIDVDAMVALLQASHWGSQTTKPMLERAIANSLCVGVYEGKRQVGFARAVTDLATYAYLTDVITVEDARGRGIGRWMTEAIVAHPDLQGLRRIALWTRDAPWLYEKCGFATVQRNATYMEWAGTRK